MTVADLIRNLQALPQDLPVQVNDVRNGVFHDCVDDVFEYEADPAYGDEASVVIIVNRD